ncbi:hypothetical protein IEQ34_013915 [Dendrobium chrysotoxum]|uniref:Uncharacterized protein n=1 Tax=Dendrobium chrysotoxum TaxID=161865 RepID=A0AAV7GK48_DENCH|nr:hypothetical protein IEQ34_013915 [Dendrobium chrysotoxum]
MGVSIKEVVGLGLRVYTGTDNDGYDESVNAKHPGHNYRHDRLHHQFGSHNPHRSHAHTALRRAVRRPHACQKYKRLLDPDRDKIEGQRRC